MNSTHFLVTDSHGRHRMRLPVGVGTLIKCRRAALALRGEVFTVAADGTPSLLPIASFTATSHNGKD